jgi:hypothetical protein
VCVPVDVECQVEAQDAGPVTPVDDIAALLGSSGRDRGDDDRGAPARSRSLASRIAGGAGAVGGFLGDAGRGLLGVLS